MHPHMMHPYMSGHRSTSHNHENQMNENPDDLPLPEDVNEMKPREEETPEAQKPEEKPDQAAEKEAALKAEMDEMRLRMAADMENFKKRLTRDHQEQMRYAAEKVLNDLLPALDNLDLAIQYGSTHEACADMMTGIEMTRKQLLDAVAKSGLVAVGEAGETFDPAIHEAIGFEPSPEHDKGAVTKVLQRGYKLHDRLLRPAKVMINQ